MQKIVPLLCVLVGLGLTGHATGQKDDDKAWRERVEKKIASLGGSEASTAKGLYDQIKHKTLSPDKLNVTEYKFLKSNMSWIANPWLSTRLAEWMEANDGKAILDNFAVTSEAKRRRILIAMFWHDATERFELKNLSAEAKKKGGWAKLDTDEKAAMNKQFKVIWGIITE